MLADGNVTANLIEKQISDHKHVWLKRTDRPSYSSKVNITCEVTANTMRTLFLSWSMSVKKWDCWWRWNGAVITLKNITIIIIILVVAHGVHNVMSQETVISIQFFTYISSCPGNRAWHLLYDEIKCKWVDFFDAILLTTWQKSWWMHHGSTRYTFGSVF